MADKQVEVKERKLERVMELEDPTVFFLALKLNLLAESVNTKHYDTLIEKIMRDLKTIDYRLRKSK